MKLSDLTDVDFLVTDTAAVEEDVFQAYMDITGRTLAQGDPIRLFLLFIAEEIVRLRNNINDTGKMNLLKYATGNNLDQLGALLRVERLPASAAMTTIEITLSEEQASSVTVPRGTRVSAGGALYFALDDDVIIPAGETTATADATCTTAGTEGNGFMPGEISTIIDPVAFVATMVNTTTAAGGSDIESDDAFRERIFEAPEKFSVAGSEGAYIYWTKTVNSNIVDVSVVSPTPGEVNVVPLLAGGEIPTQEVLNAVEEFLSADDIRPLTDNVSVIAPTASNFDIDVDYYIAPDADASAVAANVSAAVDSYINWQTTALGRDINPSKLISMIMAVNGVKRVEVTAPAFTVVASTAVAQSSGTVTINQAGSEDE